MKICIRPILMLMLFLGLASLTNALVALDNDCPIDTSVTNVNITGGTDIFLPFTYNTTTRDNADLVIFTSNNATEFCDEMDDIEGLWGFATNKTIILTPAQLNALQTASCNGTFLKSYLENFKKSGDMMNSSGTAFCANAGLRFGLSTNPSGIVLNWSDTGNFTLGSTEYSKRDFKRYMSAYMMNNPTATLSGVLSSLANAIGSSLICGGYSTMSAFFNAGKTDFTNKVYNNIIDRSSGDQLKAASSNSTGVLGWLVNYALGTQKEPIIKVANLSSIKKIYLCSLVDIDSSEKNETVSTANLSVTIDSQATTDTVLEITTSSDVTNSTVEIVEYSENPKTSGAVGVIALDKYVGIRTDSIMENAISSVMIKVYYTCLLYTSPSPRDLSTSRMPSSA